MENKRDSMIFYRSFYECLKELDAEIKAEVYDAIFSYGLDFENVEFKNIVARSMFTLIKPQLDANIRRFENGKIPKNKQTISKTEANDKQKESKEQANVNDNDNDNVNKNENINNNVLLEKETKFKKTLDERKQYFKDRLIEIVKKENIDVIIAKEFFEYWTEPNQTNTKMKFELEKTYDITRRLNTWLQNNIKFNKTNTGNNGKSRTDIQQEGKDRFREKFNQQNFGDGNRD